MTGRNRALVLLAVLVVAAGFGLQLAAGSGAETRTSIHVIGHDDAYISFRYARNLVAGDGLVFNPGERVEGYSNLLYTLASGVAVAALGPDRVYLAMALLNGLALVALVLSSADLARRQGGAAAAGPAALLCAVVPASWVAAASGLETVFVVLGQALLWRSLEPAGERSRPAVISAACAFLVLLRADGFVSAALAVAFLLVRGRRDLAARVGFATAAVVGLHFAWRRVYYGDWLPNTFHAKVTGSPLARIERGLEQIFLELSWAHALWLPLVVVALQALGWLRSGARREEVPFPVFFSTGLLGYWLWIGGDHFGERFLLVLYVFAAVILGRSLAASRDLPALPWSAAILVLAGLLALQALPLTWSRKHEYRLPRYDGWITLGEELGQRFPGRLLAVGAAGKIPYFSSLRVIDMRGLTDRHIARVEVEGFANPGHDKEDLRYVLARDPDLIAGWVAPTLDMNLGLSRRVYGSSGYRLRLLVNASRQPRARNVLDVAGWPEERVRGEVTRGYRYGVLERVGPAPAVGRSGE